MVIHATTQDDFPLTTTMILRHAQAVHPHARVVVSTPDGVIETTVGATADRVRRLTGALQSLGVQPGEAVGTFCWNTLPHLEAYFAIPATGAVLHTINLRLFPDQVTWIINDARDRVILVDASLWETLRPVLDHTSTVEHIILSGDVASVDTSDSPVPVIAYEELLAGAPEPSGEVSDERSAAAMCYTSGTTGHPKGVVYSHRSVYLHAAANLYAGGFGINDADTLLQVVPMFHANGWGFPYAAFLAGAALVLPDRHLAPDVLAGVIESQRVTVSGGVPTVWRGVFDHAEESGRDLTSLRVISCAGSAVPESLLRDYVGLGIQMYQAWGMTETSPLAAIARPPADLRGRDEWWWRTRTGIPVPGVEVRAVGEDGQVQPADGSGVGDLEVRGPWVTGGYFGGRGESSFNDGWLRTGDVGTVDVASAMKITDRAKDLIKSGGEWISSIEIEDRLSEIDGISEAACIGIPDPRWEERPLGVVTLRPGATVTLADVRAHLEQTMARWQVPERVIAVETIPRIGVGKIDKIALRESYSQGTLTGTDL